MSVVPIGRSRGKSGGKPPPKPPQRPMKRLPSLTDLGNAERFAELHKPRVRYCPAFRCWLVYDGQRWQVDESYQAERLAAETIRSWPDVLGEFTDREGWDDFAKAVNKHARKSESSGAIRSTLELARTIEGMTVTPQQLDANPWVFNCLSGTIDLRTGIVNPHNPRDLITRLAPVHFDPDARNETWTRFVKQITGDDQEMNKFLCRAAGYFLTGVNSEKCFFLAHSDVPNTGKSTFLDALKTAMGDYAMSASPNTWLRQPMASATQNRGDLARLRGARLVTSSEFDEDARFDESLIKSITGGDEITVSEKFQSAFTYRPAFKILLAANYAPKFSSSDEAMMMRTRRIPFVHEIAVLDPKVRETLTKPDVAGAAILRWMVAGCLDWQRNGLPTPEVVRDSNEAYQQENDRAAGFIEDCLVFDDSLRISRAELRQTYEKWCREEGERYPMSNQKLTHRIEKAGGKAVKKVKVRGVRHWDGVGIKSSIQSQFGDYSQN